MSGNDSYAFHALAVAFDLATKPFDGRHRPMIFGFAHSHDGVVWHADQPGRSLHQFQRIRVGTQSDFFVHIFTNDKIEFSHPLGLVISTRPSIEAVVKGNVHAGPFEAGPNVIFAKKELSGPTESVRSPALNSQTFASMWATGNVPFVPVAAGEALSFEVLVELRVRVHGKDFDFKIDPELIIEGDALPRSSHGGPRFM